MIIIISNTRIYVEGVHYNLDKQCNNAAAKHMKSTRLVLLVEVEAVKAFNVLDT